jgi:hypothetical protein
MRIVIHRSEGLSRSPHGCADCVERARLVRVLDIGKVGRFGVFRSFKQCQWLDHDLEVMFGRPLSAASCLA